MSSAVTKRVLVIGDVMTDIIVQPQGTMVHGSDCRATIRQMPGGSGANQAIWLAHFGVPVTFAARIGAADQTTEEERLRALKVTPHLAADPDLPTGSLVTLLDADGQRSFFTDRGANERLSRADLPDSLLDGVTLLHVSGYALFSPEPRAAIIDLMTVARQLDIIVTVDPGSTGFLEEVGPSAFLDWTAAAAICFPNEDEAALLTGTRDHAMQQHLLAAHYQMLVIKRGAAGAELIDSYGVCRHRRPAPAVTVVDTTGAGDAFLAGFLAARLSGADEETALARAIAAGSAATTHLGGQPPATGG